jgi:hypothetical protein
MELTMARITNARACREHGKAEPSTPHGTDREALLSRIIDDNVRLREALK